MSTKQRKEDLEEEAFEDDDVWDVLDKYFEDTRHSLSAIQTESFDNFVERRMGLILETSGNIKVKSEDGKEIRLYFTNPRLLKPMYKDQASGFTKTRKLWPSTALNSNYSYVGDLCVDIHYIGLNGIEQVFENRVIGSIPIMVGSRWCTTYGKSREKLLKHREALDDPGGYFIVRPKAENGLAQEKVIIIHERAAHDKPTILRRGSNSKLKVFYYADIKSHDAKTLFRQTTTIIGLDNPINMRLFVILPWHDSKLIPLGILFKALGVTSFDEIREMILGPNWKTDKDLGVISSMLEYSYECSTTNMALRHIGKVCKVPEKNRYTPASSRSRASEGEEGGNEDLDEGPDIGGPEETGLDEGDLEGADPGENLGEGETPQEDWDEYGGQVDVEDLEEEGDLEDEDQEDLEEAGEDEEVEEEIIFLEEEEAGMAEKLAADEAAKKKRDPDVIFARKIITHDLFPHVGEDDSEEGFLLKARYLAYVTQKLIRTYSEVYPPERRDHYGLKRGISCGARIGHQFMSALKRYAGDIYQSISKALESKGSLNILGWATRHMILTNHMVSGVSSNSWLFKVVGTPKGPKGLSQSRDIYSRSASITQVRKMRVPICDSGKVVGPRELSGDHFGNICVETPEGKQSGLVKPTALSCSMTIETDPAPIKIIVKKFLERIDPVEFPAAYEWVYVFVNGDLVGYTSKPLRLTSYMRKLRRGGTIDRFISISYQDQVREVQILSDAGRLTRPLLIVENGKLLITKDHLASKKGRSEIIWEDLIKAGVIEYLDVIEQDHVGVISGYPSEIEASDNPEIYSHCEIHPSLMFGAGIALIPFPDHNQAPRNVYQAQMGRQNIGVPMSNFQHRFHGSFNVLHSPEKPLVTTRLAEKLKSSDYPNGYNAIVAIMCAPFNEEDAIEMSKKSIDLGMFRDTHVEVFEMRTLPVKGEEFGIPDFDALFESQVDPEVFAETSYDDPAYQKVLVTKKGNFRHMTNKGYAEIGSRVEKGDVVLCKMNGGNTIDDIVAVETYKEPKPGTVVKILDDIDSEGYHFYRVQVHEIRIPEVGDKFAASHAQKGVCGNITSSQNLPWAGLSGLTPDIVLNALAFPSRMTIALVIQAAFGIIVSSGHPLGEYTMDEVWDDEFKGRSTYEISDEFRKKYMIGDQIDGTPFRDLVIDEIENELTKLGISLGEQECYDGITGELITTKIMMAPIFYQRLKHVVQDKFHARASGSLNSQTRQPPEGRSREGGHKFGVMEVDAGNGGGAPYLVKDRLCDSSDATQVWLCMDCGNEGYRIRNAQVQVCQVCKSPRLAAYTIPYGTKLMNQELTALNIVPRIIPLDS